MAKPRGKSNATQNFQTEFVTYSLSADDKKEFAVWMEKSKNLLDTLVIEVLQSGHKIGFSFNDNTDSFIVSITGKAEGCINASKCFTSHAKDYALALWVALYKFHVVWDRGVWESLSEEADFG